MHAVGRVSDHKMRRQTPEDPLDVKFRCEVTTKQSVPVEHPEVARLRDGDVWLARHCIGIGFTLLRPQQSAEFVEIETNGSRSTPIAESSPSSSLRTSRPRYCKGNSVIRQGIAAALFLAPAPGNDNRRLGIAFGAARIVAGMAGNNYSVLTRKNRDSPAIGAHCLPQLLDLLRRMFSRVAVVAFEAFKRPPLDG